MQSRRPGGDRGRGDVERCIGDRELRRIEPTGKSGGQGDQRCPAEHDTRDECDERDRTDPDADLLERFVATRHRHRHDREEAGHAAEPRR